MQRLVLPASVALVSAMLCACPPENPTPPDGDGGVVGDDGGPGPDEGLFTVETRVLNDVAPLTGRGLAVAVRSDATWAVAYVAPGVGQFMCDLFGGGQTEGGDNVEIRVTEPDGDGVRTRTVEMVPGAAAQALDLAVAPDDTLVLAYGGGDTANGYCGSSDLVVARESGAGFTTQVVATDSATASTCRLDAAGEDPYCQIGDTVGLYPGVAVDDDGTVAVSYQDFHNGFADKDIFGTDLELARGNGTFTLASVSTEAGAGYHSAIAFGANGRVIIGHQVIANNVFVDGQGQQYSVPKGLYVAVEQADGTFLDQPLVEDTLTDDRVAVGYHPSFGWGAAYHDADQDDLHFWWSDDDGATWTFEAVDQLGLVGSSPALGFLSDGTPVIAYGYCGRPTDDACNRTVDGVRVALRKDSGWVHEQLPGNDEQLEGAEIDMAVAADDTLVVVSHNTSRNRAVIHTLTVK